MRYPDGGGLTAEGRSRRERVRLQVAQIYEQGMDAVQLAGLLRVIDLSKVRREIIDLTTYEHRAYYLLDWKGRGYAMRSSEIVIDGWVPPEAITEVRGGS